MDKIYLMKILALMERNSFLSYSMFTYVVKYVHFLDEQEYPYRVTVRRRKDFDGFGLYLKSAVTKISQIIQGSPIQKCGLVKVGDLVTEINGVNITLMFESEITTIVKKTGNSMVLTIGGMYLVSFRGTSILGKVCNREISGVTQ